MLFLGNYGSKSVSRLDSAYFDKMLTTSPGYSIFYKALSRRINKQYRHLRHNASERNQTDDRTATFEDFVNYLLSVDIMTTDVHFRSYLASCKPCNADYDYVIKLETLKNDMEIFETEIEHTRLSQTSSASKQKFQNNPKSCSKYVSSNTEQFSASAL